MFINVSCDANVLLVDVTNDDNPFAFVLINPKCDVRVELIFATDVFKVVKFVVCPLTVPNNEL